MTSDAPGGFGALLRQRRLEAGLSQEELAGRTAMSVRTISNLERGATSRPRLRTIALLADALGLPSAGRDDLFAAARNGQAQAPAAAVPRQLPIAVSGFTGRARELGWLSGQVTACSGAGGRTVISAIGGTAGVGKTALAVHWAHQAAGQFPDGQLFVNLRGYDPGQPMSPADALAGFLRALGLPGQDIPAGTEERAARYRSLLAGRRMLVVLDNAGSVEQVRPLMPGAPGCLTLVTSRDSLAGLVARDGAQRLDLDLLPEADAVRLLAKLIGDRAAADPAATRTLAGQCCHLPLALRVAAELAATHPGAPLASLVSELADQQKRLDLLDAGGDPRTAVRAVFSWSCQHLAPAAARTFRLAGLHPGTDFDAFAVAALTSVPVSEARRELRLLARAHLVHGLGPDRYGLHDLLRGYARELAGTHDGAGQTRAALTRLFDYYLQATGQAMAILFPAEHNNRLAIGWPAAVTISLAGWAQARAWLQAERANLVAVTGYAASHGWPQHVIRLSGAIFGHFQAERHYPEALAMQDNARQIARSTGDRSAEGTALTNIGIVDMGQGRYSQAIDHCREALRHFGAAGDRSGEARALLNMAYAEASMGQCEPAIRHFERSVALSRELGDPVGEGRALTGLAFADLQQGDYERGRGYAGQALAKFRETGDRSGEIRALGNLGFVERRQGRYQQAADYMRQALALCRQTGDLFGEVVALTTLGVAARQQGQYREATSLMTRALALCRKSGDRTAEAMTLTRLGAIDVKAGRCRRGTERHLQALALFRGTGDWGEMNALVNLGDAFLAEGRLWPARTRYTAGLSMASQFGSRFEQARAHDGLGQVHDALGDPAQARHHWEQALARYAGLGVPEAEQVRSRLAEAANA